MKTYYVTIPIAGRMLFRIEADSKAAAKEAAWNKYDTSGESEAECVEWEAMDNITQGNCCRAPYNDVEVQESKNGA